MIATKSEALFQRLLEINRYCFTGVECPPENNFRYEYNRGMVYTVEQDNRVVGYALVVPWGGPFLWNIAVVPAARKRGLGTQLLQEIFEVERDPIELTVNVNNPAQKLYFDEGFRAIRLIKNYYGQGTAGIRMRRTS